MSKKVASTKLLSGLFVAGGVLGLHQGAKADTVPTSETTKPVITAEADNLVVVPQTSAAVASAETVTPFSVSEAASSQYLTVETATSETVASSELATSEVIATSETAADVAETPAESERQSQAQVTAVTEVTEQNLNADAYLTDPSTEKAAYTKEDGDINYSVVVSNPTDQEKTMTVTLTLQHAADVIGQDSAQVTLSAGESAKVSNLTVASEWLTNNTGYLVSLAVSDENGKVLSSKRAGLSVEADWTVFPRYGIVAGSPTDQNSILVKNLDAYRKELELMKSMNINSYFFYDAYNEATDPFPEGVDSFVQKWNTWSHTQVDTAAVKALVDEVHKSGAVAMLYNMISADSNPKNPALPLAALAYNFYDSFGKKGEPMTYTIGDNPTQVYYDPANPDWQKYIAGVMKSAMDRMGFDGWQGDTIGDNRVTDFEHRFSTDEADSHNMSDSYASFINAMKDLIGEDYYITINDVNGGNDDKLRNARQDVIYNELWTNGGSVIPGRMQVAYGDLKARIDMVREKTGKSLIVGAYMEEPGIDYTVPGGKATNGAGKDALAGIPLQGDATLLVDATVAAAGGYHMSIAALANANAALNVLQSAYYPTQYLSVAKDTIRKLYNYQQFITAYENLLRGTDVTNTSNAVSTSNAQGKLLSTDSLGVEGDQVWTFAKSGNGFSTIQMINMMGINAGWHNEEGTADNKTPDAQKNLTVRYSLAGKSAEEATKIANQVYITSPDDWSTSAMQKVTATVDVDKDGQPVLVISVPELTLWNMVYIKEDTASQPVTPVILTPARNTNSKQDQTVNQLVEQPTTPDQEHLLSVKDEAGVTPQTPAVTGDHDQNGDTAVNPQPSISTNTEKTSLDDQVTPSQPKENPTPSVGHETVTEPVVKPIVKDEAVSTSPVVSEVAISTSAQGSETATSTSAEVTSLTSENVSEASQSISLKASEANSLSEVTSEDNSVSATSESVQSSENISSEISQVSSEESLSTASPVSESASAVSSEAVVDPTASLTESQSQTSATTSSEVSEAVSEVITSESQSELVSTIADSTSVSALSEASESSLVTDSTVSSEVVSTELSDSVSEVASDTITSSESPVTSEVINSEVITQAESLFSTYANFSETASSEGLVTTSVVKSSETSVEKLAVSILKEVEASQVDTATINSIVELIDSITTDVNYVVGNSQGLASGVAGSTYKGSQDLALGNTTTKSSEPEVAASQRYADKVAKVAKSHKWGDRAIAILIAIVLSGAAALAALRNFLISKVN